MSKLIAKEYKRFEDIKRVRKDGSEYWSARELALALDYTQWRNFQKKSEAQCRKICLYLKRAFNRLKKSRWHD